MTAKWLAIRLWLALVICLSIVACSDVEIQEFEIQASVTPESTPEKSDMGVVTTTLESGVEGYVWIGPICPVVQVGTECPDRPYETDLAVTDIEGNVVANGKSDLDGFFRIPLLPGSYILVPETPNRSAPPFADPIPFNVDPGAFTVLEVNYDSGIR